MPYASVFKDETKLDINFTPSKLQHRGFQLRLLSSYFNHAIEMPGRMTQRVIVVGKVGTGKTVLTQHFGREITRKAQQQKIPLNYVHVNCRQNRGSFFLVLQQIVTRFYPSFPKRGYSAEELLQTLMQILDEQNNYLIITLDELETLIRNEGSEPLYKLSRIEETRTRIRGRLSIIGVLRELDSLDKLDASTRSTLQSNIIRLGSYTKAQLHDILEARVILAFKEGTISTETMTHIAELGEEEGGNARYVIELLWRAGKYADTEKSAEVLPEHVRKAVGSVYSDLRKDEIATLSLHKRLLLLGITRSLQQTTGANVPMGETEEAYRVVCEEFNEEPRGHTQLWKYIKELSDFGIIRARISTSGQRGKTTLIGLPRISAADLERELYRALEAFERGAGK
jgi:cell division control protein 6